MPNITVFEVEILRHGTDQLIKKMHYLGYNVFQVSHLVTEDMFGEDGEFTNDAVEVGSIKKLSQIVNIENPEFILDMMDEDEDHEHNYNPRIPFDMLNNKDVPADMHMKFKHSCGEEIICVDFEWPYILCPNKDCKNKRIEHTDIEEVGGLYIFHGE